MMGILFGGAGSAGPSSRLPRVAGVLWRTGLALAPTLWALWAGAPVARAQDVAVLGEVVHTMAGDPIADGAVLVRDGRIAAVGPADEVAVPAGTRTLRAAVVTPGLVDAHATVGLTGVYNQDTDQDVLELSEPVQPELRALDSYNARERLVEELLRLGITTVHTGHAPGAVITGQTMIAKTAGRTVDEAVIVPTAAVAATLGDGARARGEDEAPGTRAKAVALLRQALVDAQEYRRKLGLEDAADRPARDLRSEALVRCLTREIPLLVTAHRHHDILAALRLAEEFDLAVILDGGAEAYTLIDEIREAGVPVIVHPPMMRTGGASSETANATMEAAKLLSDAGIPVAFQSGYEDYVPKVRVVLFEAAVGARYGLSFERTLAAVTIDAARILGIDEHVGSLEVGKDGDLALFDGDPFEYVTHCTGVVVDGIVVSEETK